MGDQGLKMPQLSPPPQFCVVFSMLDSVGTDVEVQSLILPRLGFLRPERTLARIAGRVLSHNCSNETPGNFPGAWTPKLSFGMQDGVLWMCLLTVELR